MSEEKPSLDSSVPPEGHAFNIDLEKGLPLNTPQDIKESFGSGSPKIKRNKVVAFLGFLLPDKDYYDIKENKIKANAYTFLAEYKKETKHHFPKNVIVENRTVHCISTSVLSLLCSLAAFYHYDFLSWLLHVSSEIGYPWDFFCPLGQFFLTWATSFGVFYVFSRPIIWVAWLVAKALIFIVGGLGVVSEHFLFLVQILYLIVLSR
ncbi:hypothetical protein SOMG_04493 [Schizosaccharomyces osmophilus]|uniref:Uncharacterized protein n=1 Tax=Schizosaccharomyces osmophilus TaxID=2545709 RepID=A0AAF0AZ98_9SCHI|nr:uncharacterized protein SOMG_04493 [Schizosaccharomyces osmophilus]WBW75139.1 hypothetical protein SOMG_04493 [Schizosaccharomyces osmophilus]